MDFLELAQSRFSVRKFERKPVEQEKLEQILKAGCCAPTAVNYQPQRILVLNTEEALAKLKECTPYHFHAPTALLICYDETTSWKRSYDEKDMGIVDASIAATQMMLEIHNLGLGTTWVGHFDPQKMIDAFQIPQNLVPVALLPVGYPREDCKPHPFHSQNKEQSELVFYGSFHQ